VADQPPHAETSARPAPAVAYARWLAACECADWTGRAEFEHVAVRDGLGRVTAGPVLARWPAPRFDCAAMDGIAVRADAAAPRDRRWRLAPDSFVKVDTGDPIPVGMDAVVERERVEYDAVGAALVAGSARHGQHVRVRGEDFGAGQLLVPAGHLLRPVDLAAVAAGGHAGLEVARRPVVAIIPTGDEIRPAGSDLGPTDITDSNSIMLAAQAAGCGAQPVVCGVQPDDPGAIATAVRRAAQGAGLVLVIAGSSGGGRDHAAAVLALVGDLVVRGVAVRPGHPVLLGYARTGVAAEGGISRSQTVVTVPVIGVPGYPLAATVIFELFAAPLLAALQGLPPPDPAMERVQLTCDWTSSPDVEDWVPVVLARQDGSHASDVALATPTGHGAGAISRLLRADAWWPIPIGQAAFARGDHVNVQPIPGAPAMLATDIPAGATG
jgi:putative molybdopterin biosynthesis protein